VAVAQAIAEKIWDEKLTKGKKHAKENAKDVPGMQLDKAPGKQ
jgi:hypothetical protein